MQEYLETPSMYCMVVQFEARSRRKTCNQTRSHAVVLNNTLPAARIEKAVCMETMDELYQKVRLNPRVPRVVLKSNSQYGQQDPQNPDHRTAGIPLSV